MLRIISILLFFITIAFTVSGNINLPRNGESAIIQRVSPTFMTEGACLWDFSQNEYIDPPIEVRFYWANDSCLSASLPGIRYDFAINGDTIFHTVTETHFMILSDTIPMPYASTECSTVISSSFGSRGRAYHTEYINALGEMHLNPIAKGSIIVPSGDTISDITVTRHHSSMFIASEFRKIPEITSDSLINMLHRTTVTHAWISSHYPVPIALLSEVTDSIGNVQRGHPFLTAWVCTPENQPIGTYMKSIETQNKRPKYSDRDYNSNPISDFIVTVSYNRVSVSGTAMTDDPFEITLTDIVGRVFARASENNYTVGDNVEWTSDNLPSGQYLLHVSSSGQSFITQKIIVK